MDDTFERAILEEFERAQSLEAGGSVESAAEAFHAVASACKDYPCREFEVELHSHVELPPPALVASMALNCLGGFFADDGDITRARDAFNDSLGYWADNAMACINLGDLERAHGCCEMALSLYERAAALQPCRRVQESEWFDAWVMDPRIECVSTASEMCVLLLHQLGQFDRALPYLRRFGSRFRVAPHVWRLVNDPAQAQNEQTLPPSAARDACVFRCTSAAPPLVLTTLQEAFAPEGAFWAETDYAAGSFHSYWYDMDRPPAHAVEALAAQLLPLLSPQAARGVVGASWWAHKKPPRSLLGHQMHFDTEERTLTATGEVLHPVVTSVTYLHGGTGAAASTGAPHLFGGSPTIVFEQRVSDCTDHGRGARRAYVAHPKEGSTLFFPGDMLHCVCPAAPPSAAPPAGPARRPRDGRKRRRDATDALPAKGTASSSAIGAAALGDGHAAGQRVSLMIAFWTRKVGPEDQVGSLGGVRGRIGVCEATPPATRSRTWPRTLDLPPAELVGAARAAHAARSSSSAVVTALELAALGRRRTEAACTAVASWEELRRGSSSSKAGGRSVSKSVDADGWSGQLTVPQERDMHFHVPSFSVLRKCHGNE
jgi:hypothetical protein